MTNSTKTTKYSTIFLAAILVAGTIVTFSPSLIVGAQAVPYPDMDREKKEDKKSVSVSSLKCNNINVNVNGLELDVFPPFLGGGEGLAATAAEDNADTNNLSGNGDGSQINDFRFICINNNNNTVIQQQPQVEECAEPDEIEACFEEFLSPNEFELLTDALSSSAGLTAEINGQQVTLRSFDDICQALEGTPYDLLTFALADIVSALPSPVLIGISSAFTDCIAEALGIPIPSPQPPGE
jgi:hypothetical protein